MMRSTTWARRLLHKLIGPIFIIIVWYLASALIGREYILASPVSAALRLFELIFTGGFWLSVLNSTLRIMAGFLIALFLGTLLAALSAGFELMRALIRPCMALIHATPVVSLILLVVFWTSSDTVPLVIVAAMALPVVYLNVSSGISGVDPQLLEMAGVFRVARMRVLRRIYLPAVAPYFLSACSIALGFAWKSGVAAEVLTQPMMTIGEHMVTAKNFLENADLLAWTAVVILLNAAMERLVRKAAKALEARIGGVK